MGTTRESWWQEEWREIIPVNTSEVWTCIVCFTAFLLQQKCSSKRELTWSSWAERCYRQILADEKLKVTQQWALPRKPMEQGHSAPLLCSLETPAGALHPALGLPTPKGCGSVGTKMGRSQEDAMWAGPLCSGDTLRDLGLFSLEEQLQGDFRAFSSI